MQDMRDPARGNQVPGEANEGGHLSCPMGAGDGRPAPHVRRPRARGSERETELLSVCSKSLIGDRGVYQNMGSRPRTTTSAIGAGMVPFVWGESKIRDGGAPWESHDICWGGCLCTLLVSREG